MPKYRPGRLKLIYQDTDSLIMEVQTDDFFQDMLNGGELYDFSDHHGSHPIQNLISQKFNGDKVQVKVVYR